MGSFKRSSFKMEDDANGEEGSSNGGEEYVVDDLRDRIRSSRGSRFTLIENELGLDPARRRFSRQSVINGFKGISQGLYIHPDNRYPLSLSLSRYIYIYILQFYEDLLDNVGIGFVYLSIESGIYV